MAVLTLSGKPVDWSDPPKATDLVLWSYSPADDGKPVKASFFVICWLDHVNTLAVQQFGTRIRVIQPAFNTGVPASAGTHDFDYCMDLWIPGVDGFVQQKFFRDNGGCFWFRQPWQGFSNHEHGFPMPTGGRVFPTKVGIYVDGGKSQGESGNSSQLDDYWNETYGLKNMHEQGQDHSYFPSDNEKMKRIFDLPAYIKTQLEGTAMAGYDDWDQAAKDEYWKDFAQFGAPAVLDTQFVVLKATKPGDHDKNISIRAAVQRNLNDG